MRVIKNFVGRWSVQSVTLSCLTRLKVHPSVDRCKTNYPLRCFCVVWHHREGNHSHSSNSMCCWCVVDLEGRLTCQRQWQRGGRKLCTDQTISHMPPLSTSWSLPIAAMVAYKSPKVPSTYSRVSHFRLYRDSFLGAQIGRVFLFYPPVPGQTQACT